MDIVQRNYQIDNIKCFLIFLVVLGHFFESFPGVSDGYAMIYAFHMPAFFFIAGMFAKFDIKKIVKHLIFPYFLFQTYYFLFTQQLVHQNQILTYVFPIWIMWFLEVLILYYLLIPSLPKKNIQNAIRTVSASVILALLVGYDQTIGSYLRLSQFFVFAPFFLAGYYWSDFKNTNFLRSYLNSADSQARIRLVTLLVGALVIIGNYLLIKFSISDRVLQGFFSYKLCNCSFLPRFFVQILASISIAFLFLIFPKKRISYITVFGQYTMSVYILHGFLKILLDKCGIFHYTLYVNLGLAFLLSAIMVLLLGNPLVGKLFRKLF